MGKDSAEDKSAERRQAALDGIGTAIMEALMNEGCTMDDVIGVIDKELRDYDGLRERLTASEVLKFPGAAASATRKKKRGKKPAAKKKAPSPKPKSKKTTAEDRKLKSATKKTAAFTVDDTPLPGDDDYVGPKKTEKPKMSVEERMQKMRAAKAAKSAGKPSIPSKPPEKAREARLAEAAVDEHTAASGKPHGQSKKNATLEESIMKAIPMGHRTNSSLCAHLGVNSPFVMTMALKHLKDGGKIRMEGNRSSAKYYLVDEGSFEQTAAPSVQDAVPPEQKAPSAERGTPIDVTKIPKEPAQRPAEPSTLSYADVKSKVRHALEGGEESFGSVCSYIWGEEVPDEGSLYHEYATKAYGELKGKVKAEPETLRREKPMKVKSEICRTIAEHPRKDDGGTENNILLLVNKLNIDETKRMMADMSMTTKVITAEILRSYKVGITPEKFLEYMDNVEFQSRVEIETGYNLIVYNDDGNITVQIAGKNGE